MSEPGLDPAPYHRYFDTISRFVVGYNKSVIQTAVTRHSFGIVGASLEKIKDRLASVVASFEEIRATSESTSRNSESINKLMVGVVRSTNAVEADMKRRVQEIAATTGGAATLTGLFDRLSERTKTIRESTGRIQDLADRTNVLAINASIEAARSGSAGRGFRIIAGEVKKLASQTGDFADDIAKVITEFSAAMGEIQDQIGGFLRLLGTLSGDLEALEATFATTAEQAVQTGQSVAQITGALGEETFALNEGLVSLEATFAFLKDSVSVLEALVKAHAFLDDLLGRGQT